MSNSIKTRLALFASGNGTNVQAICAYFNTHEQIEVAAIYCNNPGAYVVMRAAKLGIPCRIFTKAELVGGDVLGMLVADHIDWIVLAGFLWLIPDNMTESYPGHIINIHPALLPAYGGKGMYGHHVHEAVIRNKEKESGISIHLVNEDYDEGKLVFQAKLPLTDQDTPESLAEKIHQLEQLHFPEVIEKIVLAS